MTAPDRAPALKSGATRRLAAVGRSVLSVLVVDGDAGTRDLYRQTLGCDGTRVHEAVDGRDALVQFYTVKPDVIITDVRLPYIDGIQLCSLLRLDSAHAGVRIIAVTGDASVEQRQRLQERGADLVMVKPVAMDLLASAIHDDLQPGRRETVSPAGGAPERRTLAKARLHEGYVSTSPPHHPPDLRCPQCDRVMQYERSHVGGVSDRHPEQWDYFVCVAHGVFQYRHRTRKVRAATS